MPKIVSSDLVIKFGDFEHHLPLACDFGSDDKTYAQERETLLSLLTEQFHSVVADWLALGRFIHNTDD